MASALNKTMLIQMANQLQVNNISVLNAIIKSKGNWSENQFANWSEDQLTNLRLHLLKQMSNNWTDSQTSYAVTYEYIDTLALKVFFYGLYILIFFLGIAGNALVCYVVLRNPSMHTVTNMFITNLALSDIFLCAFAVPFTPLYLLTYKEWVFGTALCHLVPYAQGLQH
jgi:hypothetical protein